MTNFEKYKKYILKWGDEFAIDKRDNEPKRCSGDICPIVFFIRTIAMLAVGQQEYNGHMRYTKNHL